MDDFGITSGWEIYINQNEKIQLQEWRDFHWENQISYFFKL